MRPNTPSRIHPSRLLLSPRLSPVPSVDILSSTSAIAGAAVAAIASSDAPAPLTAAAVAIPSGPARTARATTEVAAAALTVAMAVALPRSLAGCFAAAGEWCVTRVCVARVGGVSLLRRYMSKLSARSIWRGHESPGATGIG
uniref:Uncharacterized protein n=3 Tax=Oryza TaxID=4527 RepID=A0A0D3EUM6_9ORYZ